MALTLASSHPVTVHLRRLFLAVVTGSFVFLIPWIVYLASSLPSRHEVSHGTSPGSDSIASWLPLSA
jgi:hypothetical protein